jgi:hypothetical protein
MIKHPRQLLALLLICLNVTALVHAAQPVPADNPPDWVPLGAYVSWERIFHLAKHNKVDYWADACKRLDVLKANCVDTIWATNMQDEYFSRLIKECEKRNLKLLVSLGAIEIKVRDRWLDGGTYYDRTIPYFVNRADKSKALIGWVLSDEPSPEDFPHAEIVRQKFRELDPNRFCLMVTMWPQAPLVPGTTRMPVVCVDLYPFFGPNDPNGPHTPATSIHFYRGKTQAMMDGIGSRNVAGWVMGQCFTEIRGPRKYDSAGKNLLALPGSYLHWVCPTPAQIRWQVWEAIRGRAKGFFVYTMAPEAPSPETQHHQEAGWTELVHQTVDPGPNALTFPDGSATQQLVELGNTYKLVAPHKGLIQRWKAVDIGDLAITSNGTTQRFTDPKTETDYLVIVNDDFDKEQAISITLKALSSTLKDIVQGLPAKSGSETRNTFVLPPGGGTIVEIVQP